MDKSELLALKEEITKIRGVSANKDKIFDAIDKLNLKLRKTHCGSCLLDYRQIILDEINERLNDLK